MEDPSILLVDDVEANLVTLEAVLASLPCRPVRARSGNEALRLLLKRPFALVLLDVQMPEMDGFEVANYLRGNPETKDIPIIFLSAAYQTEASALRGYGSGAVDYLLKPFNPEVLRSKVAVFLELYTQKRELSVALSEREHALKELERTNAALRHFTQAASHDMGAPLRAIRSFLEALDEEVGATLSPSAAHFLARSRNAAARLSSLLKALLAYAELRKAAEFAPVDTQRVVEKVCSDLAERIEASACQVRAEGLPVVHGDSSRVYQLFLNLIGNALKFRRSDVPLRVTLSAARDGDAFRFSVEDNGLGIPADAQEHVFSAFKRLHSRDEIEGTGLGLTICREVVEQHGGKIWVESAPESGARFCFTLRDSPATLTGGAT
jgi:signal transduction histidine kinase